MLNLKKILLVFTLMLMTAIPALAYDGKAEDITVNGVANGEFQPDTAFVNFTIIGTAKSPEAAANLVNIKEKSIHQALEEQNNFTGGFDQSNYSLRPVYNEKGKLENYTVNKYVKFSVSDPAKAALFIDLLLAAGVDKITTVDFVVQNQQELSRNLIKDAVLDAKAKAEIAAAAGNRKLGRMLHLSIYNYPSSNNNRYYSKAVSADEGTILEPTDVKIQVQVDATFALE